MYKKILSFFLLLSVVIIMGSLIANERQLPFRKKGVPIMPNRAKIIGEVIEVKRADFPEVEITLKIIETNDVADYANFTSTGMVLKAGIQFIKDKDGEIIFSNLENIKKICSFYLLKEDLISAELRYHGDERGGKWFIHYIERVLYFKNKCSKNPQTEEDLTK